MERQQRLGLDGMMNRLRLYCLKKVSIYLMPIADCLTISVA